MAMTLDDLQENIIQCVALYEDQREPYCNNMRAAILGNINCFARNYDSVVTSGQTSQHKEQMPVWRAAKLYTIARDEGLSAAMLWKLSNDA